LPAKWWARHFTPREKRDLVGAGLVRKRVQRKGEVPEGKKKKKPTDRPGPTRECAGSSRAIFAEGIREGTAPEEIEGLDEALKWSTKLPATAYLHHPNSDRAESGLNLKRP